MIDTASERGSFDTTSARSWYTYAVSLVENTPPAQQRPFVSDVIDHHVRFRLNNSEFRYDCQPGLLYSLDPDGLADDFMVELEEWDIYLPDSQTLSSVVVEFTASTIDTAPIEHPENEFDTEPGIETTTFVDCTCSGRVVLNTAGFEAGVRVTVQQRDPPATMS